MKGACAQQGSVERDTKDEDWFGQSGKLAKRFPGRDIEKGNGLVAARSDQLLAVASKCYGERFEDEIGVRSQRLGVASAINADSCIRIGGRDQRIVGRKHK